VLSRGGLHAALLDVDLLFFPTGLAILPIQTSRPNGYRPPADGIAIEILNGLCKFKKLKVVGRTSSFAFKNKEEDLKSIGQKLNVNNVLEGSVQKQQDQIRISVRLTNAEDGFTVFSESYTDDVENIFDLQLRIATDIAEKIESKLELADNELHPRKKIDPLAYETFLKGKLQFLNGPLDMKTSEVFKAKKYFERSVELDSSFVEANAYLALAYFKGYSHSEIARELGIPLGTVKARIRSAMQKLRALLHDA